jgi:hypothetical protein
MLRWSQRKLNIDDASDDTRKQKKVSVVVMVEFVICGFTNLDRSFFRLTSLSLHLDFFR